MRNMALTCMVLMLCIQHENSAMSNLRNYAGRFSQQCVRLYNQGAQQTMPAYRSFTSRAEQQIGSIRPQASQWLRNMQTSARNWNQQNISSMHRAALGLGLCGVGLGIAHWQRPDVCGFAKAEEEEASSDELDSLKAQLNELTENTSEQHKLNEVRRHLHHFLIDHEANMDDATRQKFTTLVNDLLNAKHEDLNKILRQNIINAGHTYKGIATFLGHAIDNDLRIANPLSSEQSKISNIIIPDIYKKFFAEVGSDNVRKAEFIKVINDMKKSIDTVFQKKLSQSPSKREELLNSASHLKSILNQILKEVQGTSSSWWWPFS